MSFKERVIDPIIRNEKNKNSLNEFGNKDSKKIEDVPPKSKSQEIESKNVSQNFVDHILKPEANSIEKDDLNLSEEFLSQILQCVDDLCTFITDGDKNLKRSAEVNLNLNNALSCYR